MLLNVIDVKLDVSDLIGRCRMLSRRWEEDLRSLMETVPPRDEALETIFSGVERLE